MNKTEQDKLSVIAINNRKALNKIDYTGRGIILGINDAGTHFLQVYWITGRSKLSRNRVFCTRDERVWTELADPSENTGDTSLILYDAMDSFAGHHVVSNGDQTVNVVEQLRHGPRPSLDLALIKRTYEPDPNSTSRITGICAPESYTGKPFIELSILRKSPYSDECDRQFFRYAHTEPGYGRCITTYSGDGKPLQPFEGEPYILPLYGEPDDILGKFEIILDNEHLVSIAVKSSPIVNGNTDEKSRILIFNRYKQVEPVPA